VSAHGTTGATLTAPAKTTDGKEAPAAERPRKAGRSDARRRRQAKARAGKLAAEAKPATAADRLDAAAEEEIFEDDEVRSVVSTTTDGAKRTMLINVSAGDECRIAVVHQDRLEELFIERASSQSHVGNIYKGRITNVEPSIQAAFIDFGLSKNGFLHISDVQPQYFPDHTGESEDVGRKIPRYNRPPIQKCFRRGQEVIVQITKEGVGTKGPTLSTYLSIPGRFLVMMPGMSRHGVSRRIEQEEDRRRMREMLNELDLPAGKGFILRTAGLGRTKRELQRDLNYLLRLWKTVIGRVKSLPAPAELYRESDLVTRTIRDVYSAEFDRLIVDDAETAKKAREFLQIAMPRSKAVVELYSDREPLFHRFRIEEEIDKINMRHVPLPSGGSIVIDSTEALVAIDVNSGRFRSTEDAEETALQINLEAAEEIARQLRLRDLGGLIVCDFIDMRLDRNMRAVERALRDGLKEHKERARLLRMSAFGLIELTRQRQGPSMKRNIYFECQHCKGSGLVKMPESVVLDVMRIVQLAANHAEVQKVTVTVASDVAFQILNRKRSVLSQIETETGKEVIIRGDPAFISDQVEYGCEDGRGQPVELGLGRQNAI
jgi:ribonuclease E